MIEPYTKLEIPYAVRNLQSYVKRVKNAPDDKSVSVENVGWMQSNTKLRRKYLTTSMTEEERHIYNKLYLSLEGLLESVLNKFSMSREDREDIKGTFYDRVKFILLTYDPEKGSTFASWVSTYLYKNIQEALDNPTTVEYKPQVDARDGNMNMKNYEDILLHLGESIDAKEEMSELINFINENK